MPDPGGNDMGNWEWHHGLGGSWMMWLLWILVASVVALIVYGLLRDRTSRDDGHATAKRLLQERYARGDIGREEYLEKLHDLER
jgi:putative membrane protein